jgi:hypothetical protein
MRVLRRPVCAVLRVNIEDPAVAGGEDAVDLADERFARGVLAGGGRGAADREGHHEPPDAFCCQHRQFHVRPGM